MEIRLLVLEKAGFRARGVFWIGELTYSLCKRDVGLLLLCHSLSIAELESAMELTTQSVPMTPVLRLASVKWIAPIENETIVQVLDGPYKMLKKVENLLLHSAVV